MLSSFTFTKYHACRLVAWLRVVTNTHYLILYHVHEFIINYQQNMYLKSMLGNIHADVRGAEWRVLA